MKRFFTSLLLILFFISLSGYAQTPAPTVKKVKRPKVGLVLSGGGAKGFAYIGLFKVLKEVGLHIDYVAGTSIGSIMAGFYAAGYDPDLLTGYVRSQDWDMVMSDKVQRRYIPYVDKKMGNKLAITLPIDKGGKGVSLMSSISEGQNVDLLLNRFFSSQYKITDFSKLPVPFFCIATDLFTGESVMLDSGNMVKSIRASMSIPGYFNPTKIGNHYLVDGGVVNNYPVMDMKKLGVDFVIGGDVQQGLVHDMKDLSTAVDVIMQITGFSAIKKNEEGLANTDLYIHFDMEGKYDMMSFNDYDSIIAIGEKTARTHYGELKKLADSLNAIQYVPANKFDGKPLDSISVADVFIDGNKRVPLKYFSNLTSKLKNHKVSIDDIENVVNFMYGSGFFKHVSYQLVDAGDDKANVKLVVKETGLGELAAGIHYDSDYGGALLANAMFRNLLIKGSKLFVNVQMGNNIRARTLFVMDRGFKPGFGLATDFYNFKFGYYYDELGNDSTKKLNELTFTNYKFSAFANTTFSNQYNLMAGIDYELFSLGQEIYNPVYEDFTGFHSYATLFAEVNFDTRNKMAYATGGTIFKGRFEYVSTLSNEWKDNLFKNSAIAFVNYNTNIALDKNKRFVLKPGAYLGVTLENNKPPFQHTFGMGGNNNFQFQDNIIPFMGTQFIQLWDNNIAAGKVKLQYNIYKKLYVIAEDDFGMMWEYLEDTFNHDGAYVNGYGLTLAYDSFIGPVEITGMNSNIAGPAIYISIGYWF